eukprot:Protomagalhaensia_wolfi_Nauph_80__125@NODE_106_length_3690_cov_178_707204_g80_i0_p4_GENE_NODE_106_length_3690_cov_178_707204_g80_i0NODE_106_length_3690_cov_178_707204_g80_i0_p4_ORF_typecomplete_len123_score9_10PilX_N/PF14341_6/1_8PilX_N/PF14341_6/3_4e02_NODE_106_length_3690_cov_178_707204_g80_i099467
MKESWIKSAFQNLKLCRSWVLSPILLLMSSTLGTSSHAKTTKQFRPQGSAQPCRSMTNTVDLHTANGSASVSRLSRPRSKKRDSVLMSTLVMEWISLGSLLSSKLTTNTSSETKHLSRSRLS